MKKNITAHVIIIGDEILYGHTIDKNSNYLAKVFGQLSIDLIQISAIQDSKEEIKTEITTSTADIILTTGGLGPTRDDKTKYVLSEILEQPLELHKTALSWTEEFFKKVVDKPMNVMNRNQALVPLGTEPLRNKVGTAPGLWTEMGNQLLIALPGVPYEMKYLMQNEVLPRLIEKFKPTHIAHEFVQTIDIAESDLASLLDDFEHDLPSHVSLAYLPKGKKIMLRLTGTGNVESELLKEMNDIATKLVDIIPSDNFLSRDDHSVEMKVGEMLRNLNMRIAIAESFSAGKLASQITSIPGSSDYFEGGVIAYSPRLKQQLLNLNPDLIKEKGVANEQVAEDMAKGVLELTNADIAVSTTGVAGPGPDAFGVKPGIAYIAIRNKDKSEVFSYHFPNLERSDFIKKLTNMALQRLYKFLLELE